MTNEKVALITGISGQDGAYLGSQLLSRGWTVFGGTRDIENTNFWRLNILDIFRDIKLVHCPMNDIHKLSALLKKIKPQQIYHLAGISSVVNSISNPIQSLEANTIGTQNLLESMKRECPESKLFFASSSEVFSSNIENEYFDEDSAMTPQTPYGISKLAAQLLVKYYRQHHGLFACSGILFNHESPLRGEEFITRKISKNVVSRLLNNGGVLELGNFDAARDWGSAEDYTNAMQLMMDLGAPLDFVIASGLLTRVRDILVYATKVLGSEPVFTGQGINEECIDNKTGKLIARVNKKYFRTNDIAKRGCSLKLNKVTGWQATLSVEKLVKDMVCYEASL